MAQDKALVTYHHQQQGPTWMLLPGGPGMGSPSLKDLIPSIKPFGSVATIDLPDDGANRVGLPISLERWQASLLEAVQEHGPALLVGHSFGGMLIQTIPEIERHVLGIGLLNSSPDNRWFKDFGQRAKKHGLVNVSSFKEHLLKEPSDEAYANYMMHSLDYYFTKKSYVKGLSLFQSLPFNAQAYLWALREFHPIYQASFIPTCPLFIMEGELDFMTPAGMFDEDSYKNENVTYALIKQGAHFPWLEQPLQVKDAFKQFASLIKD